MSITRLRTFLTTKRHKSQIIFWFGLSLIFAIIYSLLELKQAFSSAYVVQDDARVYVSWMQRFLESDFLPNDLLADYFQSVTPFGYAALYRLIASVSIDPLYSSKILPLLLLLPTTSYCFAVSMQILPVPAVGFLTTLLFSQNLVMRDDLVSATPRSFIYLLFLAFVYYLLRGNALLCLGAIALSGLFYPPLLFILSGILILRLWHWQDKLPRLSRNRRDYIFSMTGLGLALIMMLPYALSSSEYGSVVAPNAVRALPEFSETGRIPFFDNNLVQFWLLGQHSGLLANVLEHPLSSIGFLLPILLRHPERFPLVKRVTSNIRLLPKIALVSVGMFFAAHFTLYKLFAPARYTRYTLKFVIILAAGIAIAAILDAVFRTSKKSAHVPEHRQFLAFGLTVLLGTTLVFYPLLLSHFPNSNYIKGEAPVIYEFFRKTPKDILIAGLSPETDNLPTFSHRSILVGWEYAVPYHTIYASKIRQRATDLIRAQYTQNLVEVQNFIQKYGVDFFLLDRTAFTPEYIKTNPWLKQWQFIAKDILATLEQGNTPAILSTLKRCSVEETETLIVLQAKCVTTQNLS
ncbi:MULTISPECIES: hypothetical protein [Nostocales]|uniref:Glycosyltransferase RgtA/B/C/D-like domain-containing protein n=3 Tax=Nostocales TaxID=1161 RepID=A0A0C1NJ79_9CYAN|nr:hypothetical protein [Tolypothrix bouteillei]KAF3888203.1 hypothetical protein DA73_0400023955 [Tolypothrix bouteillei VB521301]